MLFKGVQWGQRYTSHKPLLSTTYNSSLLQFTIFLCQRQNNSFIHGNRVTSNASNIYILYIIHFLNSKQVPVCTYSILCLVHIIWLTVGRTVCVRLRLAILNQSNFSNFWHWQYLPLDQKNCRHQRQKTWWNVWNASLLGLIHSIQLIL